VGYSPVPPRGRRSQPNITFQPQAGRCRTLPVDAKPHVLGARDPDARRRDWVDAWPMFIVPFAFFATANWVHIPFEEANMRRQFAATYDDYVGRIRRWL
jgi:hypothetical protein